MTLPTRINWAAIQLRTVAIRLSHNLNPPTAVVYQEYVLTHNKGWLLWHTKLHVGVSLMEELNTSYWFNHKALEILKHNEAQGLEVTMPAFLKKDLDAKH